MIERVPGMRGGMFEQEVERRGSLTCGGPDISRDENPSLAEIHHDFVTDPEPFVLILPFDSTGSSMARRLPLRGVVPDEGTLWLLS
jgi:hypothetical protein